MNLGIQAPERKQRTYKRRVAAELEALIIAQDKFRRRIEKKYSHAAIAQRLGLHKRTINKVLRRHGCL